MMCVAEESNYAYHGQSKTPGSGRDFRGFLFRLCKGGNPLGCYCLLFLSSLATVAITETKKVIIELVIGLYILSAGGAAATAL